MRDGEEVPIVLVVAHKDVLKNIRDGLAHTTLAVLPAQTKHEAIALLEGLRCEIDLAIVELELPDFGAWDLIRELRQLKWRLRKPMAIIAATSLYSEPVLVGKLRKFGVDAIVPKARPPVEWRRTVETVLGNSENTAA